MDGAPAGSEGGFDPEMTFDPLEKKFHAPMLLGNLSETQSWDLKVVRQQHRHFFRLWITEADASKFISVIESTFGRGHQEDLVATQSGCPINWARLKATKRHAPFCTRHEEGANHCEEVESSVIVLAEAHDVEAPRSEKGFVMV